MAFLLTRRDFLQAIAATGSLLAGGIGTANAGRSTGNGAAVVHCEACAATNKVSSLIPERSINGIFRCHNCGADLLRRSSRDGFPDLATHRVVPGDRYPVASDSRYIPFPNHEYLLDAAKPKLEVATLLF